MFAKVAIQEMAELYKSAYISSANAYGGYDPESSADKLELELISNGLIP